MRPLVWHPRIEPSAVEAVLTQARFAEVYQAAFPGCRITELVPRPHGAVSGDRSSRARPAAHPAALNRRFCWPRRSSRSRLLQSRPRWAHRAPAAP
jgi:hypothetical protein